MGLESKMMVEPVDILVSFFAGFGRSVLSRSLIKVACGVLAFSFFERFRQFFLLGFEMTGRGSFYWGLFHFLVLFAGGFLYVRVVGSVLLEFYFGGFGCVCLSGVWLVVFWCLWLVGGWITRLVSVVSGWWLLGVSSCWFV